ncbi:glycoside hydrolase family 38 N-terminal domain-containing protein [Aeromonas enteropelogenes]|uniref:glycoside hydrolase family 38 N-terminal domain-containing protein n=1 Tax=Aeromonas enteropelogenes TaxID=29489 RepID=UPI0039885393
MSKIYHVISHTHWDYEWYFTHSESLIQLIYHMDEVISALENGELDHYLLDGQLSIVEDYLAICPEHTTRFKKLVKSGRLKLGPWYTQSDLLTIGGESIIRNLMTGMQIAKSIDHTMEIGYVPDSFGQSIDMPKIYNGVGIKRTVFWRGLSSDKCTSREFIWRCEDGSEVTAYNIKNGYFVGCHIMDVDDPSSLIAQVTEGTLANNVVIPLGGDQRYVDIGLKSRLELANQISPEYRFVESSYDDFFDALQTESIELPSVSGELIDAEVSKIHRSIYSSRYDLKYLNDYIERNITLQLEPLLLIARNMGVPTKPGMLSAIWTCLMRNHAHDSAGGCNTDKTNRVILSRYEQARQMLDSALAYLVRKLSISHAKNGANMDSEVTIFNTLPYAREVILPLDITTLNEHFSLYDEAGKAVRFDIVKVSRDSRSSIRRTANEYDSSLFYYQSSIELRYQLPASGCCTLVVKEVSHATNGYLEQASSGENQIENDAFILSLVGGKFNLFDKVRQTMWPDCLHLIDMGDDGDTYDYSPPEHDWQLTLDWKEAECVISKGQFSERLTLTGCWQLPASLQSRAAQQLDGHVDYQIEISLKEIATEHHTLPIEINIKLDNQVKDHRMQFVVTTPFTSESNWADSQFGVVERANQHEHMSDWRDLGWKEEPSAIYPMLHFANLHDKHHSLSILTKGIKEYEILANNRLAVTLFRSVGWLGKPDLQRRPGIASGQQFKFIETPDSQLPGAITCELALLLEKNFAPAAIQFTWQHYAIQPLYYQDQSLNLFTNTMRYFVTHPLPQITARHSQGIEVNTTTLVVSALKPAANGNKTVIRLYNPMAEDIDNCGTVILPNKIQSVQESNLLEEPLASLPIIKNQFKIGHFKAKQIRTFVVC